MNVASIVNCRRCGDANFASVHSGEYCSEFCKENDYVRILEDQKEEFEEKIQNLEDKVKLLEDQLKICFDELKKCKKIDITI